jgi:hypothetical protein
MITFTLSSTTERKQTRYSCEPCSIAALIGSFDTPCTKPFAWAAGHFTEVIMRTLIAVVLLVMTGCASNTERMQSIFDALEFGENQEGCVRVQGNVALGGNPIAQSSVNVNVVKTQGENAPPC